MDPHPHQPCPMWVLGPLQQPQRRLGRSDTAEPRPLTLCSWAPPVLLFLWFCCVYLPRGAGQPQEVTSYTHFQFKDWWDCKMTYLLVWIFLIYFMCKSVLPEWCLCTTYMNAWCPRRSKEVIRSLRVKNDSEPSCGCWELNLGPFQSHKRS